MHRSLMITLVSLGGLCGASAGAPSATPVGGEGVRPAYKSKSTLPSRLVDAGWTREELIALARFDGMATPAAPGAQPAVGPVAGSRIALGSGHGACRTNELMAEQALRGFMLFSPWPDGEIIYDFSDDIVDLWLDPPDDPSANEINALLAIPNVVAVITYIESVTEGRIKFIGYDEAVHSDNGFVLIESNGPENECFNAAGVSYQANTEGQFFSICAWTSFGVVVHEFGHSIGFFHEQQRRDREDFIEVHVENIGPDSVVGVGVSQWEINAFSGSEVTPYDYGSVMHYPAFASSINGLPVFELREDAALAWLGDHPQVVANLELIFQLNPLDPGYEEDLLQALWDSIGNGDGLSDGDLESIYLLYGGPGEPRPWVFDPLDGCPTDVNEDAKVTVADLHLFLDLVTGGSPFADLDGDGDTDIDDFQIFYTFWQPGYCLVPGKPKPPPGRPVVGISN